MKRIFTFLVFAIFISSNSFAIENKDDTVLSPNLKNVVKTWFKYSDEILLSDRKLLDAYIALQYCEEKAYLFSDAIGREDFRNTLKTEFLANKDSLPHIYRMVSPVIIEDYDFDNGKILIDKSYIFDNVDNIKLPTYDDENICRYAPIDRINQAYVVDLKGKINIETIDLPLENAREILPKMFRTQENDLIFYIIVDLDITGVIANTKEETLFDGKVLDVGYYYGQGRDTRFGEYNFEKENEKMKIDYLKDLQFISDSNKSTY